jgi:hypothetical protein
VLKDLVEAVEDLPLGFGVNMNFTKASKVKINGNTQYYHHNLLAQAFNEKIISGVGDCAWRIFYYAYSIFRGLRNPQDSNYPAQDEWFKFYAYLEPKMSFNKFGWPEAQAGEAEGANVANPFMAWIFGNNSKVTKPNGTKDDSKDRIHGFWSEPIRLGGIEVNPPKQMPKATRGDPYLSYVWYDSQFQRGCAAFIPNYKYQSRETRKVENKEMALFSVGVYAAARRHLRYVMETANMGVYAPSYVPDSEKKGGIFRKKNAAKDQAEQAIYYYLSYFRGTEDVRAKHDLGNRNVTNDGFDFETFFSRQFLLAPNYSKPKYEIDSNGTIIKDSFGNGKIKYDNIGYPELFPEGEGSFYWNYQIKEKDNYNIVQTKDSATFLFQGDKVTSSGSVKITQFDTNPDPEINKNRFCLSAILIQSSDFAVRYTENADILLQGMFIDVYLDGKIYESIPIDKNDRYLINKRTGLVNDNAVSSNNQYRFFQFNKIHYFRYPVKGKVSFKVRGSLDVPLPIPSNFGTINFGLSTNQDVKVGSSVSFFIKLAHVLEMKPSAADAYVMMRVATTEGAGTDAGQMDPVGHFNCDAARKVFDNYIKFGVAYTLSPQKKLYQNDAYVSANPVYESVRKFVSSNVKMADRTSLVDYEIDGNGNSVLYFSRYAMGMKNTGVDIFRGMGPSIDQVGNRNMIGSKTEVFIPITKGKRYIVIDSTKNSSNYIEYCRGTNLIRYKHGTTFIGGDYYFVSKYSSSTIGVYELEGITNENVLNSKPNGVISINGKKQTSPGAISNQWCMFMSYNLYHPSNSSYWKPSMYGDIMGALNARCLTSSNALDTFSRTSKNVKKHLANVSSRIFDIPLVVEAPSGYNYIESANTELQYSDWGQNIYYPRLFSQSCSIYQAPYVVQSTTRLNGYDPRSEIIKVTLKGQLKSFGSLTSGRVSENLSNIIATHRTDRSDPYRAVRSDENAVIDYLCHYLAGTQCGRGIIGDVSLDNQNFWKNQTPLGCCYPRFYFVKLIPKVSAGTVMYSDHYRQMEFYLRGMSNGFINRKTEMSPEEIQRIVSQGLDGISTIGGYDSAIGDYIFEDLMRNCYDTPETIPVPPNMTR